MRGIKQRDRELHSQGYSHVAECAAITASASVTDLSTRASCSRFISKRSTPPSPPTAPLPPVAPGRRPVLSSRIAVGSDKSLEVRDDVSTSIRYDVPCTVGVHDERATICACAFPCCVFQYSTTARRCSAVIGTCRHAQRLGHVQSRAKRRSHTSSRATLRSAGDLKHRRTTAHSVSKHKKTHRHASKAQHVRGTRTVP